MVRLIEESLPAPYIMCSPYHTLVIHFTGPQLKGYHPDPHLATSYPFLSVPLFFAQSRALLASPLFFTFCFRRCSPLGNCWHVYQAGIPDASEATNEDLLESRTDFPC